MNLALFEDAGYRQLLPLTWLRATFELRCGIDRLIDKAQTHFGTPVNRVWVRELIAPVIAERFSLPNPAPTEDWCLVNSRALVTADLARPPLGTGWQVGGALIAATVRAAEAEALTADVFLAEDRLSDWMAKTGLRLEAPPESIRLIDYPWELPLANPPEPARQCARGGANEGAVHPGAHLVSPENIYIGHGALIKPGVVLDATDGPIHLGAGAIVQPNAVIEGPAFIGERTIIRPTAVIRGGTSIGPVCRVGGEIEASIIHACSNKQHDGFLGHSYVGEWVNLGADTVTSDLKNTYGTIRVFLNGVGVESGERLVGAIIGDHAKTGIGTLLPTGGVIGVAANVFTHGAVPKFVPSFAWLTDDGLTDCRVEKAVQIARTVMGRREVVLGSAEARLLAEVAPAARAIESAGWERLGNPRS